MTDSSNDEHPKGADEECPQSAEENTPKEDEDERDIGLELHFLIRSLRRQHGLAHVRYRILEFYLHSGPLVVISLVSGILSFLAAGEKVDESTGTNSTQVFGNGTDAVEMNSMSTDTGKATPSSFVSPKTKEILIITVGIFSFFQIAVQKVGQINDFKSRSKMHYEVAYGLEMLLQKMDFEQKKSKSSKVTTEMVDRWQAVFEQCLSSCTSPLPLEIKQAYELLGSKMCLRMAELDAKEKKAATKEKVKTVLDRSMEDMKESKQFSDQFSNPSASKCSARTSEPQPCFPWRGCKNGSDVEQGRNKGNSTGPKNERKNTDGEGSAKVKTDGGEGN